VELVVNPLLPAFGQELRGIDVLVEEAILVRNPQIVEHRLDHVEVRDQHRLRQFPRELFFARAQPDPERGTPLRRPSCSALARCARVLNDS